MVKILVVERQKGPQWPILLLKRGFEPTNSCFNIQLKPNDKYLTEYLKHDYLLYPSQKYFKHTSGWEPLDYRNK